MRLNNIYKTIFLILLNTVVPIMVLIQNYNHPEISLSRQGGWLALIAIGALINMFVCMYLGEAINNEGFRALLWSFVFLYGTFVWLVIWYFIIVITNAKKYEMQQKEMMRQRLIAPGSLSQGAVL